MECGGCGGLCLLDCYSYNLNLNFNSLIFITVAKPDLRREDKSLP